MKVSNYNIFSKFELDNVIIGFNCVSGGLYVFNQSQYRLAESIFSSPSKAQDGIAGTVREKLLKGCFLIEDDVDEIKLLHLKNNISRFNQNALALVITPTLHCCLDCPYCYVDREKVSMSPEVVTSVKAFFSKKIRKTDVAVICWTGGEPLLALNLVENLSTHFIEME